MSKEYYKAIKGLQFSHECVSVGYEGRTFVAYYLDEETYKIVSYFGNFGNYTDVKTITIKITDYDRVDEGACWGGVYNRTLRFGILAKLFD